MLLVAEVVTAVVVGIRRTGEASVRDLHSAVRSSRGSPALDWYDAL